MTLYSEADLRAQQKRVTSFRSEEAYITFYKESDYLGVSTPRATLTPVGTYLFFLGMTVEEITTLLPPQQAVGRTYQNLKPAAYTESKLAVNGLYTQESKDLDWISPGHPTLLVFIDLIDSSDMNPTGDNVLDSYQRVTQTFVLRDMRVADKKIAYQDAAGVQHTVSFTGGEFIRLPLDGSEFSGNSLSGGGGGVLPSTAGFGSDFGASFGD